MKNASAVRRFLTQNGYKLLEDVTFREVKFYDVICAERGKDELTPDEEFFGRTNLETRPEAFLEKIGNEIADIGEYLKKPMSEESREELLARKKRLESVL